MPDNLVVFVHGWGANHPEWWGSTKNALKKDHRLKDKVTVEFFTYETTQRPQLHLFQRIKEVFGAPRHEQLGELGGHLWTFIRYHAKEHRNVALFGHSFGGLVVADALGYGSSQQEEQDRELLARIRSVALCATPLAGAELAELYGKAIKLFGNNPHVQNLKPTSLKRKEVVDAFINHLRSENPPKLHIFRAANDGIVDAPNVDAPLKQAKLTWTPDVFEGEHSTCVQNIGPAALVDNFEKIVAWLEGMKPKVARKTRRDFEWLVTELNEALDGPPWKSWKDLKSTSDVPDGYMLRLFLQKLIYAAARIHERALGSVNLWVAHGLDNEAPRHLRSEEREGYFLAEQLIVYSGKYEIAKEQHVHFRANPITYDAASVEKNSVGAMAFVQEKPRLVEIAATQYESSSDEEAGISHVLGIPLYRLEEIHPGVSTGAPLAITVDFAFNKPPTEAVVKAIEESSKAITEVFQRLHKLWPAPGIRL